MMNEAEGEYTARCLLPREGQRGLLPREGQRVRFFGKRTDQPMYLILMPITTEASKYWIVSCEGASEAPLEVLP